MSQPFSDRAWLTAQYGDAERLRVRHETHARYSENRGHYFDWLLALLEPQPDLLLLDLGCGHGAWHPRLRQQRMRVLGIDLSAGMLQAARRQARELHLRVETLRADAAALPLADACVDRAMANHMLYHLQDPRHALRELRRVLRPGSRLVIGTNAADSGKRLIDLHDAVARDLGYETPPSLYSRFNLGHLPLVQEVFPEARLKLRGDAFRFPDVESVLRYYAASLVDHVRPLPADGSHRAQLVRLIAPELRKIVESEGGFRVPKNAGAFVVAL